jgi:hypothetical protein
METLRPFGVLQVYRSIMSAGFRDQWVSGTLPEIRSGVHLGLGMARRYGSRGQWPAAPQAVARIAQARLNRAVGKPCVAVPIAGLLRSPRTVAVPQPCLQPFRDI